MRNPHLHRHTASPDSVHNLSTAESTTQIDQKPNIRECSPSFSTFPRYDTKEIGNTARNAQENHRLPSDIECWQKLLARDRGVCRICGLDALALWWALDDICRNWESLVCLPPNLFALMRVYEIAGHPKGQVGFESRRQVAEKVRHPDMGLTGIEQDLQAIVTALRIGMMLKPAKFESWKDGLGDYARKFPGQLWQRDHIVPQSQGGANTLENCQTLCWPCHLDKTKRER